MKNLTPLCLLFLFAICGFYSCTSTTQTTETETTTTKTESDSSRIVVIDTTNLGDNYIWVDMAGLQMAFTSLPEGYFSDVNHYRKAVDKSSGLFRIERFSGDKNQDKFYIQLHDVFPDEQTLPYSPDKDKEVENRKKIKVMYQTTDENGTIKYYKSISTFHIEFTKIEGNVYEGSLSGILKRNEKDVLNVDKGRFKFTIQKFEMPAASKDSKKTKKRVTT